MTRQVARYAPIIARLVTGWVTACISRIDVRRLCSQEWLAGTTRCCGLGTDYDVSYRSGMITEMAKKDYLRTGWSEAEKGD